MAEHRALVEAGFWDPEVGWQGDRPPPSLTRERRAVIDRQKAENRGPSARMIDIWLGRGSR
jgi:hypothetical protein